MNEFGAIFVEPLTTAVFVLGSLGFLTAYGLTWAVFTTALSRNPDRRLAKAT